VTFAGADRSTDQVSRRSRTTTPDRTGQGLVSLSRNDGPTSRTTTDQAHRQDGPWSPSKEGTRSEPDARLGAEGERPCVPRDRAARLPVRVPRRPEPPNPSGSDIRRQQARTLGQSVALRADADAEAGRGRRENRSFFGVSPASHFSRRGVPFPAWGAEGLPRELSTVSYRGQGDAQRGQELRGKTPASRTAREGQPRHRKNDAASDRRLLSGGIFDVHTPGGAVKVCESCHNELELAAFPVDRRFKAGRGVGVSGVSG
jgi:hypothetical protein